MPRQQPTDEVETDLSAGEMGLALLTAAAFFFGGWVGIIPAAWFAWTILKVRVDPETARRLAAPAQAAYGYVARGELPAGTPRALAAALGARVLQDSGERLEQPAARLELPERVPVPAEARATNPARPERQGPRLLTPEEFAADPLFQAIDEQPHRFIIGHSQGGKSTAMHAMARAWASQGHPVVVCDPDAARGQWPGCEVAGYAEDYDGIGRALLRVQAEFQERSERYAEGERDFTPYHLVLDEVHEIFANVPGSRALVLDTLGRRGAKRGMRVTMGTQDNNADTLGLDSAATLNNFITAELEMNEQGRRVATVYRGNAARKKHVRQYALPPLPGAKSFIQAARPEPASAPQAPAPVVPAAEPLDLSSFLDDLLAQPVPAGGTGSAASGSQGTGVVPAVQEARNYTGSGPGTTVSQETKVYLMSGGRRSAVAGRRVDTARMKARAEKVAQVRRYVAEGKSGNEIVELMPGRRKETLALVRQVKGEG